MNFSANLKSSTRDRERIIQKNLSFKSNWKDSVQEHLRENIKLMNAGIENRQTNSSIEFETRKTVKVR